MLLSDRVAILEKRLAALPPAATVQGLSADEAKTIREEIDGLRHVFADNPEKALALPMLRKDVDSLKDQLRNDSAALRLELGRTLDSAKWIIGFITASNLGLGVLALFKRNEK